MATNNTIHIINFTPRRYVVSYSYRYIITMTGKKIKTMTNKKLITNGN
jgi:hypothetical protein